MKKSEWLVVLIDLSNLSLSRLLILPSTCSMLWLNLFGSTLQTDSGMSSRAICTALQVNGQKLCHFDQVQMAVRSTKVGGQLKLKIKRGKEPVSATVPKTRRVFGSFVETPWISLFFFGCDVGCSSNNFKHILADSFAEQSPVPFYIDIASFLSCIQHALHSMFLRWLPQTFENCAKPKAKRALNVLAW